jgi:hypothetical protein
MYELIFTILVITKTGVPGFDTEKISKFQVIEECEKTKKSMESYMDKLVREGKMFPGVFECRKVEYVN